MRRLLLLGLGLVLAATTLAAAVGKLLLVAHDLEERPLPGLRFTFAGVDSRPTNKSGATELDLPAGMETGRQIKLLLVQGGKKAEDWFLVNPQVNIPNASDPADVVLMRRSAFRKLAAEARDAPVVASRPGEPTAEDRKRAVVEAASRRGLTPEQLETAIASFADTQDSKDRGISAYLAGEYSQAEQLLKGAEEKKELDLVETLRYLGASQFEQAEYRAAAESFRKAIALHGEDAVLLSWLGRSFYQLAQWAEAEPLMRRSLVIDEKSYGPDHPEVAAALNNLAALLLATNRYTEAEPLMRRALAIDEKIYGPDHPDVATALNNLAQLLQAANRLAEAEPLMRRALAIDEKSYGPDHPEVATALDNLAGASSAGHLREELRAGSPRSRHGPQ